MAEWIDNDHNNFDDVNIINLHIESIIESLLHMAGDFLVTNRIAANDNPIKLMSIALKPLCEPPFPIVRIEELTQLMDGDGEMNKS